MQKNMLDNACIHAYHVSMEKLQVLFPEPQLWRLRRIARVRDRPVSELIRSAVDLWLEYQEADAPEVREAPPVYDCGEIVARSEDLREAAHDDRNQHEEL